LASQYCSSLEGLLSVDSRLAARGVFVAYTASWGEPKPVASRLLESEAAGLEGLLRSRYSLESLKDDPVVRAYRSYYWSIGLARRP